MKLALFNKEVCSASTMIIGVLVNFALVYVLFYFLVAWMYNPNSTVSLSHGRMINQSVILSGQQEAESAKAQYKFKE